MPEPHAHTAAPPEPSAPGASGPAAAAARAAAFAPSAPLIVAAYSILRRELDALVALEPRGDLAPSPEDIHQLRVTARRLRVGLRLFRRMLPSHDVLRLRNDLRWFARALGEVRDLDVYAGNFRAYAAHVPAEQRAELGAYELYLRRERAAARAKLAALFATPRCARLFADARTALASRPPPAALRRWQSLTIREGVRGALNRSVKRVRRFGAALTPRARATDLHELRIRAKRLRYELEFFTEIYPALKTAAKATKTLQDLLGEHQDAYTASARLRRYATTLRAPGSTGAPRLPAALDELRKGQLRHAREIRRAFRADWERFLPLAADALVVTR